MKLSGRAVEEIAKEDASEQLSAGTLAGQWMTGWMYHISIVGEYLATGSDGLNPRSGQPSE
jgi:hypothetical protein